MRPLLSPWLIACLLPVALLSGCDKQDSPSAQPGAKAAGVAVEPASKVDASQRGADMPNDVFTAPDGKPTTLGAFKGKPILVNLWATWCVPCVKEMPSLDRLADKTKGKLKVLTVNQDSTKQPSDPVPEWWAKAKLGNLERYRDGDNNLGFSYGGGLPITILYDSTGKEVWRINGGMDWDGVEASKLLASYTG